MGKIGIITLNGYFNYGNRLQNFALQEILKSLNFDVETMRINRDTNKGIMSKVILEIKILMKSPFTYKNHLIRKKNFMEFSKRNITESEQVFNLEDDLSALNNEFEYFVVGSDQVWNPWMNKTSDIFFLKFVDKRKRIAYAPSFGIAELSDKVIIKYREWINELSYISVREEEGANLIKSICGKEAEVLVDPTLLLTKEEWTKISKSPRETIKDKYLLTYFLGQIPKEYQKQIKKIADYKNLKIINLGDKNEKNTYRTGPSEFIYYINNCEIFCTDSFHGAAFSIILEKPFIVYERKSVISMYSRIQTLLNTFDLNERKSNNIQLSDQIFNMDYKQASTILNEERRKALEFLSTALFTNRN